MSAVEAERLARDLQRATGRAYWPERRARHILAEAGRRRRRTYYWVVVSHGFPVTSNF